MRIDFSTDHAQANEATKTSAVESTEVAEPPTVLYKVAMIILKLPSYNNPFHQSKCNYHNKPRSTWERGFNKASISNYYCVKLLYIVPPRQRPVTRTQERMKMSFPLRKETSSW